MAQRDAAAKSPQAEKEQAYKPDAEATFSPSASTSTSVEGANQRPFFCAPAG